jgi:hypothetical protein
MSDSGIHTPGRKARDRLRRGAEVVVVGDAMAAGAASARACSTTAYSRVWPSPLPGQTARCGSRPGSITGASADAQRLLARRRSIAALLRPASAGRWLRARARNTGINRGARKSERMRASRTSPRRSGARFAQFDGQRGRCAASATTSASREAVLLRTLVRRGASSRADSISAWSSCRARPSR